MAIEVLDTPANTTIEDSKLSISDMVDLMGSEEKEPEVKEPEPKGKEKEPEPEPEPKVEELEEPEIKLDDNIEYNQIPKRQEILKEFPELFKKFPAIEKSIYREQQYSEYFATPAEAKDASERLSDYSAFEEKLLSGDLTSILKSVKDTDEKAFGTIGDNYLGALFKVDPNAFQNNIGNVLKQGAVNMYRAGEASGNDDLKAAAQIMHNFMFGSPQITGPRIPQNNNQKSEEQTKLEEERNSFAQQRLEIATTEVNDRVEKVIKFNIDKHIDPKNVMTDYVRENAKRDIINRMDDAIQEDSRFRSILDKLWEKSVQENFSQRSKDKIREAFLSKASAVLPDILKSVRVNALKGLGKVRDAKENEPLDASPEPQGRRATPSNTSRSSSGKNDLPKGMTTLEFLNSD